MLLLMNSASFLAKCLRVCVIDMYDKEQSCMPMRSFELHPLLLLVVHHHSIHLAIAANCIHPHIAINSTDLAFPPCSSHVCIRCQCGCVLVT